ncbi:MAG: DUF4190 domain-containing protein [Lachnospiraceae bacterium]|nr:DUF4190 domain-containing protein [Lachnospiraceae bacterium]
MKCKNCGYEYNGMFCPECGTRNEDNASAQVVKAGNTTKEQEPLETQKDKVEKKQGVSETQSAENEGKTMAVLSLVFGIIGLCTCGTLWIPQILGIVFGLLGKKQGKMRGMAKGAFLLSNK